MCLKVQSQESQTRFKSLTVNNKSCTKQSVNVLESKKHVDDARFCLDYIQLVQPEVVVVHLHTILEVQHQSLLVYAPIVVALSSSRIPISKVDHVKRYVQIIYLLSLIFIIHHVFKQQIDNTMHYNHDESKTNIVNQ